MYVIFVLGRLNIYIYIYIYTYFFSNSKVDLSFVMPVINNFMQIALLRNLI